MYRVMMYNVGQNGICALYNAGENLMCTTRLHAQCGSKCILDNMMIYTMREEMYCVQCDYVEYGRKFIVYIVIMHNAGENVFSKMR